MTGLFQTLNIGITYLLLLRRGGDIIDNQEEKIVSPKKCYWKPA